MRCTYQFCDRQVGLRKFCPAHRVWVDYLLGLRAREREAYWARRGAGRAPDQR